jgi:tetratricopeptide (TPR) repeat protein
MQYVLISLILSIPFQLRNSYLKKAIASYEQALSVYKEKSFPRDWLRVTVNLSTAYAEIGNWSDAKEQAINILQSLQDVMADTEALEALMPWYQRLGEMAISSQDPEFAARIYAEAAYRFELQGREASGPIRDRLIELREQLGDDCFVVIWAEAQRVLTPALARTLDEARELMSKERFSEAADKLSTALTLISETDDIKELKRQKATILFLRGFCLRKQELWEEALEDQEEAFRLFEKLRDYIGEAHTFLEMGHLFEVMNNYEHARLHYIDAYRLYRRAEDEHGMAQASENLGRLEYRVRMFSQAIQNLEEAKRLYISVGDRVRARTIDSDLESAKSSLEYQAANNNEQGGNE